jgi:proteasome assembly chaperone (PAC2) family protein
VTDALRFHVRPSLREPALVLAFEGWNDAGEAATLAARHLAEQAIAVPLAEIDPEEFYDFTVRRPLVRLDAGAVRRIEWPRTEFRFGSLDSARELVVGIGVEPHLRWRQYSDLVCRLAKELGIRRVVLLGAFLAEVVYSRPVNVTGFSSTPDWMQRLGVEPSAYQGPTGIVGVLAERLAADGAEVLSLWAGLPHYISVSPNPRGALALVKRACEALAFRVDETRLVKDAAEFEERASALVSADPELTDYVRQLKRREFAQ